VTNEGMKMELGLVFWVGFGKYQMTASDKNRKTKRANKMLTVVTKAV